MAPRGSPITDRIPYGAHVILLFLLTFSVLVLVVLITFSSPFIGSINFVKLPAAAGATPTTFGAFGWCGPGFCLPNQIAYEYGNEVNRALTGGMILWAISIIFAFFTILSVLPLLFVHDSTALRRVGNKSVFQFFSDVSAVIVVVSWLLSIYGWSIARRSFQLAGVSAKLGSAIWMGLAAAICTVIIVFLNWPAEAWDGTATQARGGGGRGLPVPPGNGYYHYKRSTREVVPRY